MSSRISQQEENQSQKQFCVIERRDCSTWRKNDDRKRWSKRTEVEGFNFTTDKKCDACVNIHENGYALAMLQRFVSVLTFRQLFLR